MLILIATDEYKCPAGSRNWSLGTADKRYVLIKNLFIKHAMKCSQQYKN